MADARYRQAATMLNVRKMTNGSTPYSITSFEKTFHWSLGPSCTLPGPAPMNTRPAPASRTSAMGTSNGSTKRECALVPGCENVASRCSIRSVQPVATAAVASTGTSTSSGTSTRAFRRTRRNGSVTASSSRPVPATVASSVTANSSSTRNRWNQMSSMMIASAMNCDRNDASSRKKPLGFMKLEPQTMGCRYMYSR